jgi:integrase
MVQHCDNQTLSEFLDTWLGNTVRERVKPSTYARYYERIQGHINPEIGALPVCDLNGEVVQAFADRLTFKGLSPSTVTSIVSVLYTAMERAVELQCLRRNPCEEVSVPAIRKPENSVLNKVEQLRLEHAVMGTDVKIAVFLALYTGLRIGEICSLRWRDVNFETQTLTVRGTIQRVKNFDDGAKTLLVEQPPQSRKQFSRVSMSEDIADMLRPYRSIENVFVVSGSVTPIEPRTLRSRLKRISGKVGFDVSFSALRHTYEARYSELLETLVIKGVRC